MNAIALLVLSQDPATAKAIADAASQLSSGQNATLIGLLLAIAVPVITGFVFVVKWLCSQVTEQGKRFADSNDQHGKFIGENTQVLMRLKDSHDDLREKVDNLPRLAADELQRRKLA